MAYKNIEKVKYIGNWLYKEHIQKTVYSGIGIITDIGFNSGGGKDSDVNLN
jgi:hypothetical protein